MLMPGMKITTGKGACESSGGKKPVSRSLKLSP